MLQSWVCGSITGMTVYNGLRGVCWCVLILHTRKIGPVEGCWAVCWWKLKLGWVFQTGMFVLDWDVLWDGGDHRNVVDVSGEDKGRWVSLLRVIILSVIDRGLFGKKWCFYDDLGDFYTRDELLGSVDGQYFFQIGVNWFDGVSLVAVKSVYLWKELLRVLLEVCQLQRASRVIRKWVLESDNTRLDPVPDNFRWFETFRANHILYQARESTNMPFALTTMVQIVGRVG